MVQGLKFKAQGMASVERFEDLRIWQQAREICRWFQTVVLATELKFDFKLKNQADASSGSAMDNIAEGFERNGNKEFIQFLSVAKASAGEFRSQLYRMYDRGYINEEELNSQRTACENLGRGISTLMNYLSQSDQKGWKFMEPSADYSNDSSL